MKQFDKIVVINLKERTDRRRQMEQELERVKLKSKQGDVSFFPAYVFPDAGKWPGRGARGCFMSHYQVIKQAYDEKVSSLLVLEDDCSFSPDWNRLIDPFMDLLESRTWGMVYVGHSCMESTSSSIRLLPAPKNGSTAHCYAIHQSIMAPLLKFLEQVMVRAPGDPLGGPQHYDGALNMFRWQHREVLAWITDPSLAKQCSSKSDISPKWFDSIPLVCHLAKWARILKS